MTRSRLLSPLALASAIAVLAAIMGIILFAPASLAERLCGTEFMPHGACYLWIPEILWLHVVSDSAIALSYFLIPVGLIYFVIKRRGIRFRGVFWLFGAFILLCGLTHLLEVYSVWSGAYVLTGSVKLATGAVSLATAFYLLQRLPAALQIPLPEELRQVESSLVAETQVRQATERALDTRNQQFAAILQGGLDAFLLLGREGQDPSGPLVVLEANQLAEEETGRGRPELLGAPLESLFEGSQLEALRELLARSGRLGEAGYREFEIPSASGGRSRWLYFKTVRAGDAVALFFADISDRKWAEAERAQALERKTEAALIASAASAARAQAALASAAHGILIIDEQGRILETNQRLRDFFGYGDEELQGQRLERLVPDAPAPSPSSAVERSDPLLGHRKDGSEFPVEVGLTPFATPEGSYAMASVFDISERVAAKESLEAKNQEIEQMLYAVSHDLKAPLVSVQGLTRLLVDTSRVEDPQTVTILNEIEKAARQMGDLISDLLEMSRVGHAEESADAVDVGETARDVMVMLTIESEKIGCEWKIHEPLPTLYASRKRIVQLLQNLCSNALKYGCSGYVRRIEIGSSITESAVEVYVQDFGAGIEESQHAAVFEPFTRLHRHVDGTGIGLAIVSKIMAHYGGAVELVSRAGQGARFILRFPRSLLERPNPSPARAASADPAAREPRGYQRYLPLQRSREKSLENNYLTQFVYAAAHDLHSPMVTISGQLSFLQEVHAATLPGDAQQLIAHSIEAADSMADYIKLLVEFSGVLLGKRAFKDFDPRSACQQALSLLDASIEASGAEVSIGSLPKTIKGDQEMFVLLIRHLISNSIKFVPQSARPEVHIEGAEAVDHWSFAVIDHGIGIAQGNHELAFRPFQKLNKRTDYPGSGIGLTICRKVVEAHNGSIWIDPEISLGTTIRFTFGK